MWGLTITWLSEQRYQSNKEQLFGRSNHELLIQHVAESADE